jgi:hypothetical protein
MPGEVTTDGPREGRPKRTLGGETAAELYLDQTSVQVNGTSRNVPRVGGNEREDGEDGEDEGD